MRTAPFRFQDHAHSIILFAAFALFLGLRLPGTFTAPYYADDYNNFRDILKISSNPLAPFVETIQRDPRRHPFFAYVFFLEHQIFGLSLPGYYLFVFLIHIVNCFLLSRLVRALGGDATAALLSGLLFLFSSAFYSVLITLTCTPYTLCFLFFILALLSWIQFIREGHPEDFLKTCLFQALAQLNCEAALVFPLLALLTALLLKPKETRQTQLLFYGFLLILLDGLMAFYLLNNFFHAPGGVQTQWISAAGALNFLPKFLSLLKMFFQPLWIPEKGFLTVSSHWENLFRLLPLLGCTALLLFILRGKKPAVFIGELRCPLVLIGFFWIGVTVLPFLPGRATFEHITRYMYFPMAGFCLIFGAFMSRLFKLIRPSAGKSFLCLILLGYIFGLNALTTSFHLGRYKLYMSDHTQYQKKIIELFEPVFRETSDPGNIRTPAASPG